MKKITSPEKLHFYCVPLSIEEEPEICELRTNVTEKHIVTDADGKKKKPTKKIHEKINAELDALMRMIFLLFSLCASCYNRVSNPRCNLVHPSGKPLDSGYISDWLLFRMVYGRATNDDEARIEELFGEIVAAGIICETEPDSGVLCMPIFQRVQSFVPDDDDNYADKRIAANWRMEKSRLEQREGRKATQKDKNAYLAKVAIRKSGNINTRDYLNELHNWCYQNAGDRPGEVPTTEQWLKHLGCPDDDSSKPRGKECKPVDVDADDFDDGGVLGDGTGEYYGCVYN